MTYSRRKFLLLSSLGYLGAVACNQKFSTPQLSNTAHANLSQGKALQAHNHTSNSADDVTSPSSQFPQGEPLLRFVSVGDVGTGAQGQYAVAQAMQQYYRQNPFPMVLLAGDNIYNHGEIEKVELVFELPYQSLLKKGVKFHACLGNHDVRTDNGDPQVQYPGYNMQGRYYSFTYGPVQYFALDTNDPDWEQQLTWLKQALANSSAQWKVVFGHHQIYSSGIYGLNSVLIEKLTPIFQQYGVQLYINGHDHHYERTQVIDGTTYVICGAGAGVRDAGRSNWTENSASRLSFAAFDVYADQMVVKGIATDGTIFDQGIIKN